MDQRLPKLRPPGFSYAGHNISDSEVYIEGAANRFCAIETGEENITISGSKIDIDVVADSGFGIGVTDQESTECAEGVGKISILDSQVDVDITQKNDVVSTYSRYGRT